ncbi:MAG: DUF1576 domain-containing protein [Erysipelotrichales bacterium]|nr:DUF1576 domain-containing protein [Erysipelotrichales bacterium]
MFAKLNLKRKLVLNEAYLIILFIYLILLAFAFIFDSPRDIYEGFLAIISARSILITDYIELGGLGATIFNAVLTGTFSIIVLMIAKVKPSGSIIMGIWLLTGFSMFGKNIVNVIPIILGVWLYATIVKKPFRNYAVIALLAATVAPIINELTYINDFPFLVNATIGFFSGIVIGFIFPPVGNYVMRVHAGYDLYNLGFAGGLISLLVVAVLRGFGITVEPILIWNDCSRNTMILAVMLYITALILMLIGIISSKKRLIADLKGIMRQSGQLASDFYFQYHRSTYFNMGLLCALSTTLVLVIGQPINGPVIAGIFTIVGFGAFGKHVINVTPVILGAILASFFTNSLSGEASIIIILFSTGLAPVSGRFGWYWGIIAGFLHFHIAQIVTEFNGGLNLYNNGFAAGFVVMILLPLIGFFTKEQDLSSTKLSEAEDLVYNSIVANPNITIEQIASLHQKSVIDIYYLLRALKRKGFLKYQGPPDNGFWVILR